MPRFKTGDICPQSGRYKQTETGEEFWVEQGDKFAEYYKKMVRRRRVFHCMSLSRKERIMIILALKNA